jgi:hypothetical protein
MIVGGSALAVGGLVVTVATFGSEAACMTEVSGCWWDYFTFGSIVLGLILFFAGLTRRRREQRRQSG